ncbi:MAG: N-6 DNA Methylase [Deltaproteobacteria bacterium ADurb.Bin135]|nr:MAG: N-6 DNA Methylase [Deltaproteobacteria bacterium ADurb.Bin135]
MTLEQYIDNISKRYKLGNATEHTFRGDLQQLIEGLVPEIRATNEPKRQSCGAPDYILTKKDIPIGFIEAKDIGNKDLDGAKKTGNKEQFDRYKASLSNLIFTDYIDFHLYHDGQFITRIAIGELTEKGIKPLPENFATFEDLIKDFCTHIGQTIKSSKKLAEMMAGKARLLSDVIEKALTSDETNQEDSTLKDQMNAFRQILIHDITPKGFADVYAQTIAYGMFAARLNDPSLDAFSRQKAAELIPKSNPFLRKLFGYIAGPDIDDRIKWIVDSLAEIFLACNVKEILKNYGKSTKMEDPIIHFYETFLSEYDPKLRKARGVWYTPHPIVYFIVRAIDYILKTEFNLQQGLADNSKIKINVNIQGKKIEQKVHKVQFLDPSTGTATFLAELIKHIYQSFEGQQGIWSNYVETHLLPRIHGFEILMASYAMAHLKLDMLLKETGFQPTGNQRLRVYLTNSLEESHPDTGTLFATWLSTEANEANHVKRDTPVMVVTGNPPYSVSSSNKSKWIERLTADYKKDLHERNIQPLSDDYIKFIRLGQHFIDKNGEGILAYISNNSFLDGIIHRQMRKHLLESFDKIYILDLHGNAKKKEVCPDGSPDQNVFDIMQGVSINIFLKTGKKKKGELGKVFHYDLQGEREFKYDKLNRETLKSIDWDNLEIKAPSYFFVPKNFIIQKKYDLGFDLNLLFPISTSGIKTHNDQNLVSFNRFTQFNYKYHYRVFDDRFICYNLEKVLRHRFSVMKNVAAKSGNISLITTRQESTYDFQHVFISKLLIDINSISLQTKEISYCFPLYLYPETNEQQTINQIADASTSSALGRTPNLNPEIVKQIAEKLGLTFLPTRGAKAGINELFDSAQGATDAEPCRNIAPIDLLDYIYAVLHSPTYREKYKEFLKINFPRVPYPKDVETFWQLVKLGGEIRQIHLLESPVVEKYITQYPIDGDNVVSKVRAVETQNFASLQIWINETQYFANVPEVAWNFYIGGYQPAQKWLKDRKDRKLEFDDILHYQKIIVALTETDRLTKEIDKINIE